MPELLTVVTSSLSGLASASVVNILSSNIINIIQYVGAIILNKNQKAFQNMAIKVDICLVFVTIIVPVVMIALNLEMNINIIPIFIILYALIRYLNGNAHKLYLKEVDKKLEEIIEREERWERNNKKKTIRYTIHLVFTGISLFIIGNLLGNTLESLCNQFNISQVVIGIVLGAATSIPELITFFESQKHYKNSKKENQKQQKEQSKLSNKGIAENDLLGVVEATNNLLTSNALNIFVIQVIGIVIYSLFSI